MTPTVYVNWEPSLVSLLFFLDFIFTAGQMAFVVFAVAQGFQFVQGWIHQGI